METSKDTKDFFTEESLNNNNMTLQDLIFDVSLYQWIKISEDEELFQSIKRSGAVVEGYNPYREVESTFVIIKGLGNTHVDNPYDRGRKRVPETRFDSYADTLVKEPSNSFLVLKCKRYEDLFYIFFQVDVENDRFRKVGQNPSVADFHLAKVKKYTKYLGQDRRKEFTKAIGLYANGIGIGSFVYLRRVFESLIFDAGNKLIREGVLSQDDFYPKHMDEKIEAAKSELPDFLVANKSIYGILSKGVHELSEEECLSYFDVVKKGIEMILDEIIEKEQKEKSKNALSSSIATVVGKIKK